uniref:Uncharacterized protein n=1 Tax=Glossina morsitans morsitans TaxID=37546 RepID=A0A1B0GEA5_GLOMM
MTSEYTQISSKKTKLELKCRLKEQKATEKVETRLMEKKNSSAAEEEISPNEYFKLRSAAVAELKKSPETDP